MNDITRLELEKRQLEERLRMVTRARAVMAECNRVQARASDEIQLLQEMCRIVVESGGYRMAWIGMAEHDAAKTIRPVASAGDDGGYLASSRISWSTDEAGQGPAGNAVRTRQPHAARSIQTDPYFSTRFKLLLARGYRSNAALPLITGNEVLGVLCILSDKAEAFDADELALLEELAHDIAYGLSNARLRATQRRAEQLLALEHTVTRCLAQSESAAQALRAVMRAVCETQGWDCGRYFRPDEAAGVLRFDEAWGVPSPGIEKFIERSRPATYAPGAGLVGRVWESGEPLWIADLTRDSRPQRLAYTTESGIRAAFLFPVTSEGRTIGVLSFSSREIREPDERLLQAVHVIGSQIGQYVHRLQGAAERERAEQLQNLEHAVAHSLAESEDTSAALKAVMRAVCETEGWEAGRYFRADDEAGVLRYALSWSVPDPAIVRFIEESRDVVFPRGSGLSGKAWESGQPLWSIDIESDTRALPAARAADRSMSMRGAFVFPVTAEGKVIGLLNFSSRKVREPDDRLLRAVHAIGSQIGQFVQRKEGDEALHRFRAAMDTSSDMIMLIDRATMRYVDVNTTACELQGYTREEMLRMGPQEVAGIDRGQLERVYDAMIAGRQTTWDRSTHRRKDGTLIPVEVFRRAVQSNGGWIIVSIVRDVSERARAEQLRNLEHAVAHSLAESDDAAAAVTAVMRLICETEGWECGRYFRVDEAAGVLRFAGAWHVPEPVFEQFIERSRDSEYVPGAGLVGRVWQSGQPLWSTDLHNDPRALRRSHSLDLDLRAAFNFPVTAEGKTIGVLSFSTRKVRDPDDGLLRAIHAIGSQIGQFLRRKQAEQVLRESEARFRSLTTLSSDWYWEQDAEYRFVDMTSEIDRMTGVSALAHIGKRRWELAAPNMTEADWAAHRAVVEAHQPFHDLELCRAAEDGSLCWVAISGEPMFDTAGNFRGYRGIGRDITERKREDRLLALEHAVTRSLAEADSTSVALKSVLRAICESQGWECGRYLKVDEAADALRFHEFWNKPGSNIERFIEGKREAVFAPGVGLAGRVWQSGQPLWAADTINDERALGSAVNLETGMRGAFVFPVMAEGKTIGVLSFNSRQVRDPDERLLRSVRVIGRQIGQFLQRKQSEERVRDQALQQRLIAEFGQRALGSPDLAEVLHRATELVSGTLKTEYCSVLELVPGDGHLIYRAVTGWPLEWIGERIVPISPGGRLAHIIERREPLVTESYSAEGFSPSLAEDYGIRSAAQVPIFGTRGSFGVLSAYALRQRRFSDEEVSFLRSVANILAIAVERKNAEDKLAHLAQFDTVTDLPNRYLLRDRLGQSLTQAQRNNWLGAVLFVDLDRFKAVNDTFGHSVGDKLLREVAARLKECVRSGDTVARLSGDEFAVVLSNLAKSDDAGLVAQKVVAALAAPFDLDGHQAYISASVGIALHPGDGGDADALLKNADTAMYRAKEQGRNCYQFYLPQMNERLMERLKIEAKLRGALDRGEFVLHYQPKVQLDTGVISGFEALLRWKQDDRLVPPAEFIPILEETGLIVPVGEWVVRDVCGQIKQWKEQGITPRPIAVNLSTRQFQQKNLTAMIQQILHETGVAPELLELELTETLLMSDAEEAVQMLRELKGLGVRLSVDDFGTGYSSLSYLKRFPLDTLKIDRAFINDAVSNPDDATLTLTIINLAHSMRLKVVAEGVETQEQLNFLRLHGCDEMQGYYFARPLEVQECTRALVEDRRLKNPEARPVDGLPALLIVDDSDDDRELLKRALASNDFRILTAASPAAGFEMLARHGAAIVISDYNMPGMSGVEFLSHVRKLYPNAVRVVATGGANPPTLTGAINSAGIHKFLSKDWDAERLRAEVREAYRQRRSSTPP